MTKLENLKHVPAFLHGEKTHANNWSLRKKLKENEEKKREREEKNPKTTNKQKTPKQQQNK